MKRISVILITLITIFTCSTCCLAAPEDETAKTTATEASTEEVTEIVTTEPAEEIPVEDITVPDESENTTQPETGTVTEADISEVDESDLDEALIVPGYGFVSFSLHDVANQVTMIIVNENNKEYTLEFNSSNNYIVQESLPVGQYHIKSLQVANSKKYKVKSYEVTETKSDTFTVKETDFMSVNITATVKKEAFIIGFIKREWFMLLILIGLVIAYQYKRTHRVLPSQEA